MHIDICICIFSVKRVVINPIRIALVYIYTFVIAFNPNGRFTRAFPVESVLLNAGKGFLLRS